MAENSNMVSSDAAGAIGAATSTSTAANVDAGNIDPSVYAGDVRNVIFQTAKIKVDCEGTEAAAVTEILVKTNGIEEMRPTYDMVCNRPFAYYIYDTVNNDVAFMGVVNCK